MTFMVENDPSSQPSARAGTEAGPHAEPNAISWSDASVFCKRLRRRSRSLRLALLCGGALHSPRNQTPAQWAATHRKATGSGTRSNRPPTLRQKHAKDGHTHRGCTGGWLGHPPGTLHYSKKYPVTLSPVLVTIHSASLPLLTITKSTSKVSLSALTTRLPEP